MPPKPGPPPRQVSRDRIRRRRLGAFGGILLAALIVFAIVKIADRGNSAAPPTTVAIVQPKPFRIVFPEGFTRAEMAQRVQVVAKIAQHKQPRRHVRLGRTAYLRVSQPRPVDGFGVKKHNLEGFLFPATCDFLANTTSKQLVQSQLDAFHANWGKVDLSYARKKNLTAYDVLIIASLVEKEALAPDERPKIARVIYNRLDQGIPLGVDATLCYLHDEIPCVLHQSDLDKNDPYNTRKNLGLPPTPISSPGKASLEAALHPDQTNAIFYVLDPNLPPGEHFFTADAREFEAAKARCRAAGLGCD